MSPAHSATGSDTTPLDPGLSCGRLLNELPTGVINLGAEYVGSTLPHDALVDLLTAPLRLDEAWPEPAEPYAIEHGWLHIEVTDDDRSTFEAVAEQFRTLDTERFAEACQELRLPVCPYRPLTPAPFATAPATPTAEPPVEPALCSPIRNGLGLDKTALDGSLVIDLSTHWAGPLSTKLLAEAGATVIKLDPDCRPDGFRARPDLYQHLNGDKQIIDLDLRRDADRDRFQALLAEADLLVESFSRRVMANLGYGSAELAARFPHLATLSIKAFPLDSPERDWLAFGPGVHAASGLGLIPDRTPDLPQPRPAPVAYPDFLTGLAGFAAGSRLIAADAADRTGPGPTRAAEVTLAGSIAPLIRTAAQQHHTDGRLR